MRHLMPLLLLAFLGLATGSALQAEPPGRNAPKRLAELKARVEADNRNNPVASVAWSEEALNLLAAEPDPQVETWFLISLVDDLNMLSDYARAQAFVERARALVARTGDERNHLLLEEAASSLLQSTERPLDALAHLRAILPALEAYSAKHPQDAEVSKALGRAYRIQGSAFQVSGMYSNAIEAYQKCLKVCEASGYLRGQAIVLSQMGILYGTLERFDEAVASHNQGILLAEQLKDKGLQASNHLALASTYGTWEKPEAQLASLKRALALADEAQDYPTLVNGLVNLPDAYLRMKNYRATLEAAEAALKVPTIAKDPSMVAICQINRGVALNHLGSSGEGLKSIQDALRHVKGSQSPTQIAEVTGTLAEEYAFAGDWRRAYETAREFKTLSDDLKRVEDKKRIAEASAAFEWDKKQIQIDALEREQKSQARLRLLWIALGVLGFSIAGVLVRSRKKLQRVNQALSGLNDQNLDLIEQLRSALAEVRTLQGLIPICAHCKKIRDDQGYWNQMEGYIQSRTEALFSHGICPDCVEGVKAEFERELS